MSSFLFHSVFSLFFSCVLYQDCKRLSFFCCCYCSILPRLDQRRTEFRSDGQQLYFHVVSFFFFFFFVSYLYDVCLSIGVSTPLTIAQASKAPTHTNANISKHASAPIETFLFFFLLCDEVTNTSEADEKKARAGGKKKKKDESCQK